MILSKGLTTNKLSNLVGWASCPPWATGSRVAHPTVILKKILVQIKGATAYDTCAPLLLGFI
ncbi:hypothetical protein [Nostoc sp.]